MFVLILFACSEFDYSIVASSHEEAAGQSPSVAESGNTWEKKNASDPVRSSDIRDAFGLNPPTIDMLFDAALQRMDWGGGMTRCHIQISFRNIDQDHPTMGDAPPLPTEAGECVYHQFSGEPMGPDNWYVSGNLTGPEEIYLLGEREDIVLMKSPSSEDGRLRYEMRDCNHSSFPFEESFDLHIPAYAEEGDLSPVHIENALYVGPDLTFLTPNSIPQDLIIRRSAEHDLDLSWQYMGDVPSHEGVPIPIRTEIELHNNSMSGFSGQGLENLRCLSQEPLRTQIESDELVKFELNSGFYANEFVTGLSVLSIIDSPPFEDPWGFPMKARSIISIGGMLELVEPN